MQYQIKLEKFEGPLFLLLELIEKRKLCINDVSLAEIADQYLSHLKELRGFPMEEVANFVSVASTLILIKSTSLLPFFELSEEETGDIKELQRRLQFYCFIRDLAKKLEGVFGQTMLFEREAFIGINPGFVEPKNLTKEKLFLTLKEIISNLPLKEIFPETIVKKTISLEKKAEELINRIKQQIEISFADAFNTNKIEKIEIIVGFLAVLELIKQGIITAEQNILFENFKIKKKI